MHHGLTVNLSRLLCTALLVLTAVSGAAQRDLRMRPYSLSALSKMPRMSKAPRKLEQRVLSPNEQMMQSPLCYIHISGDIEGVFPSCFHVVESTPDSRLTLVFSSDDDARHMASIEFKALGYATADNSLETAMSVYNTLDGLEAGCRDGQAYAYGAERGTDNLVYAKAFEGNDRRIHMVTVTYDRELQPSVDLFLPVLSGIFRPTGKKP